MISASPRRLTVFTSVVDLGGFNVAATRLGIAQPSVGAHVKALEAQIGQPLFRRQRGSKPQLTKAGEAFYAYAIDALRKTEETALALADLRKGDAGEIVIAVHRSVLTHVLPALLAGFARRYPKIRIVTRTGTIEEVVALIREAAVHLGLFLAAGPLRGLRSEILRPEPLALVAAPDHPLRRPASVSPAEIARHPFVTGLRGSPYFEMVDTALKKIGVTRYEIAMEVQESAAVKEMVRHGAGIACVPACTVKRDIAAGELAEIKSATSLPDLELRCGYRLPLDGAARKLLTALRDAK